MRKTKYIRIDETPRKIFGSPPQLFMDSNQESPFLDNFGEDVKNINPLASESQKGRFAYPSFKGTYSTPISAGSSSRELDIPPYLVEQIIKTNSLILEFNIELEQRGVPKTKIEEFQYDSYKISLKITEGILLHYNQPWMASRQFDLARIHAENTIITLDNFETEQIGSRRKVDLLRKSCSQIIFTIVEFKRYFKLNRI